MNTCLRLFAATLLVCALSGCQGPRVYNLAGNAPVDQRATVDIPTMLDPLSFDGGDAPRDYVSSAKMYRFVLAPGDHELELRYSGNSDDLDPARREIVRSPARKIQFTAAPGLAYRIGYRVPEVYAAKGETLRDLDVWIEPVGAAESTPPVAATPPPVTPAPVLTTTNAAAGPAPALDALKSQWEQATPEERDAFWKWQGTR